MNCNKRSKDAASSCFFDGIEQQRLSEFISIGYERQKSVIIEKVEDNFKLVTIFRKFEVNFKYALLIKMKLGLVSARAKTRLSYPKMKAGSSGKIGNNERRFLSKIFLLKT